MARVKIVIQVACDVVHKKGIAVVEPPKQRLERVAVRGLSDKAARQLADLVALHGGEGIRLRKKSTKHLSEKVRAGWEADNTPPDDEPRCVHYSDDKTGNKPLCGTSLHTLADQAAIPSLDTSTGDWSEVNCVYCQQLQKDHNLVPRDSRHADGEGKYQTPKKKESKRAKDRRLDEATR